MEKISAVIPTNEKRKRELLEIIRYLEDTGFFDEIIVAPDKGKKMYTRYSSLTANDVIYTQDDDCIVENIQELIDNYDPDFIVANTKKERKEYYDKHFDGKICLVGWGAIFNKRLIENINDLEQDEVFFREADRAFTIRNKKKLIIADDKIKDFPSSEKGMCKDDSHFESMNIMFKRLCES